MRGRKAKPTNLHVLHGNPGKRKQKTGSLLSRAKPHVPRWMPREHRKIFSEVAKFLFDRGVTTIGDGIIIELIATHMQQWRLLAKALHEKGITYRSEVVRECRESNIERVRPEAKAQIEHARLIMSMVAECGLTPASRQKIGPVSEKDVDPVKQFLANKPGSHAS